MRAQFPAFFPKSIQALEAAQSYFLVNFVTRLLTEMTWRLTIYSNDIVAIVFSNIRLLSGRKVSSSCLSQKQITTGS
ncbi:MAG: hypothetical protein COA78_00455 [Blastopirellula sp.]|nr:MAG: hypothetical protein COA78_00455 [Blastopirellula sp.]